MKTCKDSATDEAIMSVICKVYDAMDADAIRSWTHEEARRVVSDQIKMDKENGITSLPYDVDDFYETIRELSEQDYPELYGTV